MATGKGDQATLAAVLRNHLPSFIEKVFQTTAPGKAYLWAPYVDAIAYQLEKVLRGDTKRLIINLPPRFLKSTIASVAFPAFMLGHDPTKRFACVSYGKTLAQELGAQSLKVMQEDWFRKAFPSCVLDPTKQTAERFQTTANGFRFSTSLGGAITGTGADIIIVDDLQDPESAMSEKSRRDAVNYYRNTLASRLDDPVKGAIVVVCQRLHEDDLVAHLLEDGGWTHLKLPAIAEKPEKLQVGDNKFLTREAGESLHPERVPVKTFAELRKTVGSATFSAQWQQAPVPPEGTLFRMEEFRTYEEEPPAHLVEYIVQSIDPAASDAPTSDYSVVSTWYVCGQDYYLVDILREKLSFPDLKQQTLDLGYLFHPDLVIVEGSQIGIALIDELKRIVPARYHKMGTKGDKLSKAAKEMVTIREGRVHLPSHAPWLEAFVNEVRAFDQGKHDDQVDSMVQFLRAMRIPRSFETMRRFKREWSWPQ